MYTIKIHTYHTYTILLWLLISSSLFAPTIPFFGLNNHHQLDPYNNEITICPYTIIRIYSIARLKPLAETLQKIQKKNHTNLFAHSTAHGITFTHPLIKESILEIRKKQSLEPLLKIWTHITHYRFIDDLSLVKEFIQLGILVMQDVLYQYMQQSRFKHVITNVLPYYEAALDYSFYSLIENIDTLSTYCTQVLDTQDTKKALLNATKTLHTNLGLSHNNIETKELPALIMTRFYYIHRIKDGCILLKQNQDLFSHSDTIRNENPISKHSEVQTCLEAICAHNNFAPLQALWNSIQKYKHVHDHTFIHEFILMLILLFKQSLQGSTQRPTENSHTPQQESLSVDEQELSNVPTLTLLDSLDSYIAQFEQQYHVTINSNQATSSHTWPQLTETQWWVPPLVAALSIIYVYAKASISPQANNITPTLPKSPSP